MSVSTLSSSTDMIKQNFVSLIGSTACLFLALLFYGLNQAGVLASLYAISAIWLVSYTVSFGIFMFKSFKVKDLSFPSANLIIYSTLFYFLYACFLFYTIDFFVVGISDLTGLNSYPVVAVVLICLSPLVQKIVNVFYYLSGKEIEDENGFVETINGIGIIFFITGMYIKMNTYMGNIISEYITLFDIFSVVLLISYSFTMAWRYGGYGILKNGMVCEKKNMPSGENKEAVFVFNFIFCIVIYMCCIWFLKVVQSVYIVTFLLAVCMFFLNVFYRINNHFD